MDQASEYQVTGDPNEAYRQVFTSFMMMFVNRMGDGTDTELPVMLRCGRVILAYHRANNAMYQAAIAALENDVTIKAHCKNVSELTGVDYETVLRRELEWREMEELQKLAVRVGLWGRLHQREDEEGEEFLRQVAAHVSGEEE